MIQFDQDQRLPIKIILALLSALELIVFLLGEDLNLEQYVTISVILLAFPIAYFSYQYLRIQRQSVKTYEPVEVVSSTEYTNKEIEKLQASQEYKQYMQRKRRESQNGNQSNQQNYEGLNEQEFQKRRQIQKILQEFQQKETEIFDFD